MRLENCTFCSWPSKAASVSSRSSRRSAWLRDMPCRGESRSLRAERERGGFVYLAWNDLACFSTCAHVPTWSLTNMMTPGMKAKLTV